MTQTEAPGSVAAGYREALAKLEREDAVRRLSARDPTLWKRDPKHGAIIANRLGWLDGPAWLAAHVAELRSFGTELRDRGFTHVLLLGMGGSSLAAEVLARTQSPAPGAPTLEILDSTDPSAVASAEREARLDRTFFLVSSKSGRTIETLSQYRYFRERLSQEGIAKPGERFGAITDADSALDLLACAEKFSRVFLNPADVGGRYSALSYFGMVPAAALGLDLESMASLAAEAGRECADPRPEGNAALRRAALIAAAALAGRDKLTIVTPPRLRPIGFWIEQLVAESTGKEGVGIIPVEGEPLGSPKRYRADRCFLAMDAGDGFFAGIEGLAAEARRRGDPWIAIDIDDPASLAAEFHRWAVATSLAGALLGIDPFDEPNVQESKDRTASLLAERDATGAWPEEAARTRDQGVEVRAPESLWTRIAGAAPSHPSLEMVLGRFLALADPEDYVAYLAFVERTAATEASFLHLRGLTRDALGLATLQGYGPRYLHSIGQLYKGGPKRGMFLLITTSDSHDLPVPRSEFTFGELKRAQALGDLASLESRGRPVLRLHLLEGVEPGLKTIGSALERALASAERSRGSAAVRE